MKSKGFAVAPGTHTLVAIERTKVIVYVKKISWFILRPSDSVKTRQAFFFQLVYSFEALINPRSVVSLCSYMEQVFLLICPQSVWIEFGCKPCKFLAR